MAPSKPPALVLGMEAFLGDSQATNLPVVAADSVAAIPYSSGTTGLSKGVQLTHHNLVANVEQFIRMVAIDPETDLSLAVLPFFHIYGQMCVMNLGLRTGQTTVVMRKFELRNFLALIEQHKVTRVCVAPPIILALAKDPIVDQFDLSSLRLLMSGAAPLDEELAAACQSRLGPSVTLLQGYGMTELSPMSHLTPDPGCLPAGHATVPLGSVGYAAPGTECRLVDPFTNMDAPVGDAGELWVRGPQVMRGYLNRPAETVDILVDGWLRTGDLAVVDELGRYSIIDRLKELIKYKGYQIAPAELEGILLKHGNITDAAVIGRTDPAAGEVPVAFVVRSDPSALQASEVMTFVNQQVAPYKKLRGVVFIDSIPKSPSGKILRRLLRTTLVPG